MTYAFSDRMASLQPSAIREILKNTSSPDVIPFAAGNPAPEAFPLKEIENITRIIMGDNPVAALQYSVSEGYPALRDAAFSFAEKREPGIRKPGDTILIVSGAQQGIELAAKCLINEGDTVLSEDPSFVGALNALRSYHPNLVGVPMEEDGMNLDALEKAMQTQPNVKLLYIIPNFQNPTGITTNLEKRKAIYELCKRYGVMILEDNPYGDLRFDGSYIPAIKTMDTEGLVIYVGSFSKIISPGLRVGYVIANSDFMAKMVVAKQCSDVHTNILAQMVCERFLISCNMNSHLLGLQKIYKSNAALLIKCLEEHTAGRLTWRAPQGGMFIWCTLPEGSDMVAFCKKAAEAKVAVVPGSAFLTDPSEPCRSFRMNYSTPSNKQIISGCEIMGGVLKDFLR